MNLTDKITSFVVGLFGTWAGTLIGKYIIVFIISLMPILELRGGLLASSMLGLPMWQSYCLCLLGNILPIPFILWFINPLISQMKKIPNVGKFVTWCEKKSRK